MTNPVIRPATRADIETFSAAEDKPSIRALAMEVDGRIIGLGGIALSKGRWIAFADLGEEARRYKMHIMRAAYRFLRDACRDGIRFIYAEADPCEEKSVRWLTRLGFERDPRSGVLYRWRAG